MLEALQYGLELRLGKERCAGADSISCAGQRGLQPLGLDRFGQVIERVDFERFHRVLVMGCHKYGDGHVCRSDLLEDFESSLDGHSYIEEEKVDALLSERGYHFAPVAAFADDLNVCIPEQERSESVARQGLVIGDEDFQGHTGSSFSASFPASFIGNRDRDFKAARFERSGGHGVIVRIEMSQTLAGVAEHVAFEEGQNVRKGQLLFTIDAQMIERQIAQERGELERDSAAEQQSREWSKGMMPRSGRASQRQRSQWN